MLAQELELQGLQLHEGMKLREELRGALCNKAPRLTSHARSSIKAVRLHKTGSAICRGAGATVPRQKCPCNPHQKFLPSPPLLFQPYFSTMPHRALAPISGNIPYKKELSRYKRGVVIGFAGAGVTAP